MVSDSGACDMSWLRLQYLVGKAATTDVDDVPAKDADERLDEWLSELRERE